MPATDPDPTGDPRPATRPLTLAVEATRMVRDDRGIGRYVRALLPRMAALHPGLRLVLYTRPRDLAGLAALHADDPTMRGRVDVRPIREMPRARADAFWYPWNVARPAPRRGVVVATVHDIVPVALPDPRLRRWRRNRRWRRLYEDTARRASLLVVDSAFTGEELRRAFGVPPECTRVVPLGVDPAEPPPPGADDAVLARLGLRCPFVLAVGAAEPRKNLQVLDRAMPRVVAERPDATLVLAGPRGRGRDPVAEPPWKRTLGFVSEGDLAALYRSAACVVVPSTYEGFGLPVLEAMRLGTPVIAARRASLPEVGGDAAAWVEPDDDAGLAAMIVRVLSDPALRAAMRDAGVARAARFTWEETARLTLAALEEAVSLGERLPAPAVGGGGPLAALRRRLGAGVDAVARLARLRP